MNDCAADRARWLFESEPGAQSHPGDLESICGMVQGTPFDMTREVHSIIGMAASAALARRSG